MKKKVSAICAAFVLGSSLNFSSTVTACASSAGPCDGSSGLSQLAWSLISLKCCVFVYLQCPVVGVWCFLCLWNEDEVLVSPHSVLWYRPASLLSLCVLIRGSSVDALHANIELLLNSHLLISFHWRLLPRAVSSQPFRLIPCAVWEAELWLLFPSVNASVMALCVGVCVFCCLGYSTVLSLFIMLLPRCCLSLTVGRSAVGCCPWPYASSFSEMFPWFSGPADVVSPTLTSHQLLLQKHLVLFLGEWDWYCTLYV